MEKFIAANGLTLCYEEIGESSHPVLLLVGGLSMQHTDWPPGFVALLADNGFRVIKFDNRDIGLSTKMDGKKVPGVAFNSLARMVGIHLPTPYKLVDMAEDAMGLLKALKIDRAHIVGVSMGGMISQICAAKYPDIIQSLCSIMSTTGARHIPGPGKGLLQQMTKTAPYFEGAVKNTTKTRMMISSPGFPPKEEDVRARVLSGMNRSRSPAGYARQMAAIISSPSREDLLRSIKVPTQVIHGDQDILISPEGGIHTASLIPNSKLELIEGMGHDLPEALWPKLVELIVANSQRD